MCRSRRELSNEYFVAQFGFDTAENEPCKVCPLSVYRSLRSTPILLGMQDIGKQTHTNLSQTVQGSESLMASIRIRKDPATLRDWGGNITTESVNTYSLRKKLAERYL